MRLQSVAILTLSDDGAPSVTHIDLAHPDAPFVPTVDWAAVPWGLRLHLAAAVGVYIVGVTWLARTEARSTGAGSFVPVESLTDQKLGDPCAVTE